MPTTTNRPVSAMTAPQRLLWMDFLRGTAVVLVMVNHAIGMAHVQGWDIPEWLMSPTRAFEPFRLPMLLVISGMFLPRALSKPLGTYVSGKVRNLVWPIVLWAPLVVLAHIPERAGDPSAWIGGPSHLWYLWTLAFCYAVALFSRWVPMWMFPVTFLTILFGGLSENVNLFWFGSFFFIGALIQPVASRLQNAPQWVFGILLGATVTGSLLHVAQVTSGQNLVVLFFALSGALAMIWLAPRIPRGWFVRLMESVGRRSVVYYVVHLPVIAVIYRSLRPLGLPTVPVIVFATVAAFVAPVLLMRIKGHQNLFTFPDVLRDSHSPLPAPATRLPQGEGRSTAGPTTSRPAQVTTSA